MRKYIYVEYICGTRYIYTPYYITFVRVYIMFFFCGFTCASLSFNLNPISLHIAQIPDGCQRHRRKSTDGFFFEKPWNDRFGILPYPKWGTWLVDHCGLSLSPLSFSLIASLSLDSCHFMTDICPSFHGLLSVRVWSGLLLQRAGLSSCALGKCTMSATATI